MSNMTCQRWRLGTAVGRRDDVRGGAWYSSGGGSCSGASTDRSNPSSKLEMAVGRGTGESAVWGCGRGAALAPSGEASMAAADAVRRAKGDTEGWVGRAGLRCPPVLRLRAACPPWPTGDGSSAPRDAQGPSSSDSFSPGIVPHQACTDTHCQLSLTGSREPQCLPRLGMPLLRSAWPSGLRPNMPFVRHSRAIDRSLRRACCCCCYCCCSTSKRTLSCSFIVRYSSCQTYPSLSSSSAPLSDSQSESSPNSCSAMHWSTCHSSS